MRTGKSERLRHIIRACTKLRTHLRKQLITHYLYISLFEGRCWLVKQLYVQYLSKFLVN
jgi:hypothetical protein